MTPGCTSLFRLYDIFNAFGANSNLEVRGVFADISKAFDRWYNGLIYKVKCVGINGIFLKSVESFFSNRYQRVALNGQTSFWADVKVAAPQGSYLLLDFYLFTSMIFLKI